MTPWKGPRHLTLKTFLLLVIAGLQMLHQEHSLLSCALEAVKNETANLRDFSKEMPADTDPTLEKGKEVKRITLYSMHLHGFGDGKFCSTSSCSL